MATHTVAEGETLSGIAAQHGLSLGALLAANPGITDPDVVFAGQVLQLPGEASTAPGTRPPSYVVEPGDSLSAIAERFGTSVAELAALNGLADPDRIEAGDILRLPGDGPGEVRAASGTPILEGPSPGVLRFDFLPIPMPPGSVTGGYGEDYGGYLHRGIDIGGVAVGRGIVAPAGGVVRVHRPGDGTNFDSFGICVVIDHPGTPWWSIYAHMESTPCRSGDRVEAGDVIGAVGFTGFVIPAGPAGAHLHWQLSTHPGFPRDFATTGDPAAFLRPGLTLRAAATRGPRDPRCRDTAGPGGLPLPRE